MLYLALADISGHNGWVDDCANTTVATVAGGATGIICEVHTEEPDPPPKTPTPAPRVGGKP